MKTIFDFGLKDNIFLKKLTKLNNRLYNRLFMPLIIILFILILSIPLKQTFAFSLNSDSFNPNNNLNSEYFNQNNCFQLTNNNYYAGKCKGYFVDYPINNLFLIKDFYVDKSWVSPKDKVKFKVILHNDLSIPAKNINLRIFNKDLKININKNIKILGPKKTLILNFDSIIPCEAEQNYDIKLELFYQRDKEEFNKITIKTQRTPYLIRKKFNRITFYEEQKTLIKLVGFCENKDLTKYKINDYQEVFNKKNSLIIPLTIINYNDEKTNYLISFKNNILLNNPFSYIELSLDPNEERTALLKIDLNSIKSRKNNLLKEADLLIKNKNKNTTFKKKIYIRLLEEKNNKFSLKSLFSIKNSYNDFISKNKYSPFFKNHYFLLIIIFYLIKTTYFLLLILLLFLIINSIYVITKNLFEKTKKKNLINSNTINFNKLKVDKNKKRKSELKSNKEKKSPKLKKRSKKIKRQR